MRPVQDVTNTGRAGGVRGASGAAVRALAIGTGLVIWLFVAMFPVAYATAAVPSPLRLRLVTAAMAPIWLAAGAWIRRRYGAAFQGPLVAGSAVLALLLLGLRLLGDALGVPYNEVAFGWPGLLLALTMPPLGGALGARLPAPREMRLATEGKMALAAAVLWAGLEFGLRRQLALVFFQLTGSPPGGGVLAMLVSFPLLALAVTGLGATLGIGRGRWELRWDRSALLAGLAGGAVVLALISAASWVDRHLFGQAATSLVADSGSAALPLWVAALFLVTNGLVVPVAEELAWRGVIQTGFGQALGPLRGLLVTAVLFALKHVIVDWSAARLTTLLALSLVLGVVRWRRGTGASTVTHVVMNTVASAPILIASLGE
ncbi:membrane protease YdiL (CAAX protease family) [Symbiobacterium terraclitae]|uniref:Membrane protease YdiL (CAAX protease family) n=1 Tax=Symbiobacterium terraclitae TaxID=557451 RepID=A0ABS4JV56_9FIRM|nr:CPBP family intramembrane glutamic endopeptidase [Symbiobacterium terraclitae]MBP2018810.1 membrane protease YdiL (CAAX protease family) [Symbiobacterium terraclitae]